MELNFQVQLFFFVSLLTLFSSLLTPSLCIRCHQDDYDALVKINKSLNGPYILASWRPNTDCCSWYCLDCNKTTNRVTTLTIGGKNISGEFPGPVEIPAAVGDLQHLDTLILRKLVNLTGPIPPAITKLKNLTLLRLDYNNLIGPVPDFLSQLSNLDYLHLGYNHFSGEIPASLSKLSKLTSLYLDRNNLTGRIPDSFGESNLQYLVLAHNQLSGQIPAGLGRIDFMVIDLSRNRFVGDATVLFGHQKTTQTIDISRNLFEFNFSNVRLPKILSNLDINHNMIFGSLPEEMTQINLQFLNVSYNRLCGEIPRGGNLQVFGYEAYFHNKCLCGPPLPNCTRDLIN